MAEDNFHGRTQMNKENGSGTYPLMEHAAEQLVAASGKPLGDVNEDALAAGSLSAKDLATHASTLRQQATIARDAGFGQLAENLMRAAELAAVPNDEVLQMYEALRPGRSSYDAMLALADRLQEVYDAEQTAAYVREAAMVYRERGLCRAD